MACSADSRVLRVPIDIRMAEEEVPENRTSMAKFNAALASESFAGEREFLLLNPQERAFMYGTKDRPSNNAMYGRKTTKTHMSGILSDKLSM